MAKVKLPDFEDYLRYINLDAVAEAILNDEGNEINFAPDDFENIKEMIYSAGERWLARDIAEVNISSIEEKTYLQVGDYTPVSLIIDLSGTLNGILNPFEPFAGRIVNFDWKTRDGELDTRWKDDLIDSWQWRIYCAYNSAAVFNYRGISRRCVNGACPTRDIIVAVPESNSYEVEEYLQGMFLQRKGLIDAKLDVWPRYSPKACNAFGRECPYKYDCDNYTMPKFTISSERKMSYTQFERFKLCPERYRRGLQEDGVVDASDESQIGKGFHRGIAELWRQAKEVNL